LVNLPDLFFEHVLGKISIRNNSSVTSVAQLRLFAPKIYQDRSIIPQITFHLASVKTHPFTLTLCSIMYKVVISHHKKDALNDKNYRTTKQTPPP
jgi:hypothetical protein